MVAKVHTSPSQSGTLSKGISVVTDAPEAQNIKLAMKFTIATIISMTPRSNIYVNALIGDDADGKILLHRDDGKKLVIKEIRNIAPGITVTAVPVEKGEKATPPFHPENGDVWLIARADDDITPGNHSFKAWLSTNDPELPEMEVPVTFRIRAMISAHPEQVRLWVFDNGRSPRGTIFRVVHNAGKEFEVTGVTVEDEGLIHASLVDSGPARMHSIRVEPDPSVTAESVQQMKTTDVIVSTSDPAVKEIRVPVQVAGRMDSPVQNRGPANFSPADMNRLGGPTKVQPQPLPTGTPAPQKR